MPSRTTSTASRPPATSDVGLQLLSPRLHRSIQAGAGLEPVAASSRRTECFGWSTTPPEASSALRAAEDDSNGQSELTDVEADFDFSNFTLASTRGRQLQQEMEEEEALRELTLQASSASKRQVLGSHSLELECQQPADEHQVLAHSAGPTRAAQRLHLQRQLGLPQSSETRKERESDRQRPVTSATAAAAGWPLAKSKRALAVSARGWLQRRRRLVLKRWKPSFCLFKGDDSLCLYASEDTVNGRLELRFQVLRVTLSDKNDAFHVIGVDPDGAPRREELRAATPELWARWFAALRHFFDRDSLQQALLRRPDLAELTPSYSDPMLGRVAHLAASSLSSGNQGYGDNSEDGYTQSQDGYTRSQDGYTGSSDGYTSLSVDSGAARANYEPYDERRSYLAQSKSWAPTRAASDGLGDDQRSTVSSFSGSSGPGSSWSRASEARPGQQQAEAPAGGRKQDASERYDCPMIERESQKPVPMLEIRGSESMRDSDLAAATAAALQPSAFSWTN